MRRISDERITAGPSPSRDQVNILRDLWAKTPVPEPGWGWREPESAWWRLVGQICAVGSSRAWTALENWRDELPIPVLRAAGSEAEAHAHQVLSRAGIRYCSPRQPTSAKARAVAANAQSSFVADDTGQVCLLQWLRQEVGEPEETGIWNPLRAAAARQLLIRELQFVGPKSASDFLLGLGLADSVVALDVRILNLLVDCLGWDPAIRQQVARISGYELVENQVIAAIGEPTGFSPLAIDRVLFHHYSHLRQLWTNNHEVTRSPRPSNDAAS